MRWLVLPLALAACGQQPSASNDHAAADHGSKASTASAMATDAAMARMHEGMGRASDDPDESFMRMMVAHHQGAIDMARIEVREGKDEAVRQLARDIIVAQEREVAQMQAWLAAHKKAPKP